MLTGGPHINTLKIFSWNVSSKQSVDTSEDALYYNTFDAIDEYFKLQIPL